MTQPGSPSKIEGVRGRVTNSPSKSSSSQGKERLVERLFHQALRQYLLIRDGDRVLVGLSGGKDSMALLELLAHRSRIFMPKFTVEAAFVRMTNIPYQSDENYLRQFTDSLGVKLHVRETAFDPSTDHRHTPCFLCSWYRRKELFNLAQQLGCNKLALGHHRDDFIQTALMNLTFQGQFSSMQPILQMDRFPLSIIRPLCLISEADLQQWAAIKGYLPQKRECPYEHDSHRHDMKDIIHQLQQMNPDFHSSFYRALERTF